MGTSGRSSIKGTSDLPLKNVLQINEPKGSDGMAVLHAYGIEKTYHVQVESVQALKATNLIIDQGDFIMINGPSGSGKTTLLNLLAGIDTPCSGYVQIEERILSELSDAKRTLIRRDRIGLIFQAFELISVLTALENVEYPLLLQKISPRERRHRATELLSTVGLEKELHRLPGHLSGGQKQRVAIARALVTCPSLILADEPTGNLDSVTGRKIIELLWNLSRTKKVAVVVVTHDLALNHYADRIFQLLDGVLTEKAGDLDVENCMA